ncbi:hypothetical protein Pyn_34859 [Prunus yedoensis var. nudiflora]|uniref:Uncharacterized protein n=1 Tax=Prunus yedoensis var. nudiflora TaxID=2094558 RepID=A0A314XWP1_PRUYE|nr:hypothetical protein Pyn_34859 [Prunus yedoensis var. nudiflora]
MALNEVLFNVCHISNCRLELLFGWDIMKLQVLYGMMEEISIVHHLYVWMRGRLGLGVHWSC